MQKRISRKLRQKEESSPPVSFEKLLTDFHELRKKIEKLEREIYGKYAAKRPPEKPRMGRPKALSRENFGTARDNLSNFFEMNWPELRLAFRTARKPDDLLKAINAAKAQMSHPFQPEFYQEPEKFCGEL